MARGRGIEHHIGPLLPRRLGHREIDGFRDFILQQQDLGPAKCFKLLSSTVGIALTSTPFSTSSKRFAKIPPNASKITKGSTYGQRLARGGGL